VSIAFSKMLWDRTEFEFYAVDSLQITAKAVAQAQPGVKAARLASTISRSRRGIAALPLLCRRRRQLHYGVSADLVFESR
jgi:hypothetical protein